MIRRTPLRSGSPIKRKSRLRARKVSRRFAARRNPEYLAWIRSLPCLVCGSRPSDPHHVRGRKLDDVGSVVPLCNPCHRLFHDKGRLTVERLWGLDLMGEAARIAAEWSQSPIA